MSTIDEVLATAEVVDAVCVIDGETRIISVPTEYKELGVESDEKVTRIKFRCPKIVGDNVDLTEYNLYINYRNAANKLNSYLVEDVAVTDNTLSFSWLLSRHVTESPGTISYIVCAKKSDDTGVINEWNTKVATGTVGIGLEATQEIEEQNIDAIEQILRSIVELENKVDGGGSGGYYAPSVDADGNLTWTPSKADMPAVDGTNIKGPQGKSAYQYAQNGGYTGTETEFAEKLASGYNFYIDLAGDAPNYTCQVAMDDIEAAYNAGYNLVCRCQLGAYTATLPLFVPMPDANVWLFSGSGALDGMGFGAQAFTIAITANGVLAQQTWLATEDDKLPNPNALTFTGAATGSYDGSEALTVEIPSGGGSEEWIGEITELFKLDVEADSNLSSVDLGFPLSEFWNYKEIRIQVRPKTNTSLGWVYFTTVSIAKFIFRTTGASHIWKFRPRGDNVLDTYINSGNPSIYNFNDDGTESHSNHSASTRQAYIIPESLKSQNVRIYPLNAFTLALNISAWGVK